MSPARVASIRIRRRQAQRRVHLGGGPESQGGIRNAQDVGPAGDLDVHVRRHAGLQLELVVRHIDHGRVGHHVLLHERIAAGPGNSAAEVVGRVGVHPERHLLAGADAPDVRFVEIRHHLHLGQVRRQHEQRRRLHAGRHRLADVDVARDHQAIDRRVDHRVIEVHLVLVQRRLRLGHLRFGGSQLRFGGSNGDIRGLELALRNQLPARQLARPRQLGLAHRRARPADARRRPAARSRLARACSICV